MAIIHTVDTVILTDELLSFEIDIPKGKLSDIPIVMKQPGSECYDFVSGLEGFDLTQEKVKAKEIILIGSFSGELLIFQIGSGEIQAWNQWTIGTINDGYPCHMLWLKNIRSFR